MKLSKESSVERAKEDLARRLNIDPGDVAECGITEREFSDMSLGAPANGEMSAQMISNGWQIRLEAKGKPYEYRADKYQLRLHNFNGENYVVE